MPILKSRLISCADTEIVDLIDQNLAYIAEHLRDYASFAASDGDVLIFEIDDEPDPYIRRVGEDRSALQQQLHKMDPYRFEDLCSKILRELGSESGVTQKTRDGGVDFFAFNFSRLSPNLPFPRVANNAVVGQAKRYASGSAISETLLREFIGGALLKIEEFRKDGKIGVLTPVLYAYWTTSDFDLNAKKYARTMGMWCMNGRTLAEHVSRLKLEDAVGETVKDV